MREHAAHFSTRAVRVEGCVLEGWSLVTLLQQVLSQQLNCSVEVEVRDVAVADREQRSAVEGVILTQPSCSPAPRQEKQRSRAPSPDMFPQHDGHLTRRLCRKVLHPTHQS